MTKVFCGWVGDEIFTKRKKTAICRVCRVLIAKKRVGI
jgi:hypothetical protein